MRNSVGRDVGCGITCERMLSVASMVVTPNSSCPRHLMCGFGETVNLMLLPRSFAKFVGF